MRMASAIGGIVLVTVAASLLVMIAGVQADANILGGFIPARMSGLIDFAGVTAVPALLTPLSCALLHANLIHLGMNMLMLVVTGRPTEDVVGSKGILILYIAGAFGSAAAQWAADPASVSPMIGASGAASAVIGAYALTFGQSRARAFGPFSARIVHVAWLAAAWTVLNLAAAVALQGAGVAIAAAAHIGGFLVGLLLQRPLLYWRVREMRSRKLSH